MKGILVCANKRDCLVEDLIVCCFEFGSAYCSKAQCISLRENWQNLISLKQVRFISVVFLLAPFQPFFLSADPVLAQLVSDAIVPLYPFLSFRPH